MSQQIIKIENLIVLVTYFGDTYDEEYPTPEDNEELKDFELVQKKLIGSDHEDGGGEHEYIIKQKSTGKYYRGYHTDWDVDNTEYNGETHQVEGRCDISDFLTEVTPHTVTITEYRPV